MKQLEESRAICLIKTTSPTHHRERKKGGGGKDSELGEKRIGRKKERKKGFKLLGAGQLVDHQTRTLWP